MTKKPSKWDKAHNSHLAAYEKQIDAIYAAAAQEAAKIGVSIHDFNPDKLFSFADYPITRKRVDKLLQGLNSNVYACIVNGIKSEWKLSNDKNDELCDKVFAGKEKNLTQSMRRRYYNTNEAARDAFINRKNYGLKLSDRVWRYTNQFKEEIELGLDCGIRDGLAASEMARDLKQYLRNPDKLFRRVRDEHGQLQLSKRAAAYHPGQGVYRSSYKNARRLTVTEGSMAYHSSDYERWQQLGFVVGIEIILSKNHPVPDICDDLKGRYPKDFKFTGWHPHCRCSVLTVLKTQDEMAKDTEKILAGEPLDGESVNAVKDVPENFREWIKDNAERVKYQTAVPYFIKDNTKYFPKGFIESFGTLRHNAESSIITDIKETMLKLKDPTYVTEKDVKNIIGDFAKNNPVIFNGGLKGVKITEAKGFDAFMANSRSHYRSTGAYDGTGNTIIISKRDIPLAGGAIFNPYHELQSAIRCINLGKELTFNQEYAIESLWHEMRHAAAVGWKDIRKKTRELTVVMEAVNQFCARRTYGQLLSALGGKAYKIWVKNIESIFKHYNIPTTAAHNYLKNKIITTPYEDILETVTEYLTSHGVERIVAEKLLLNIQSSRVKFLKLIKGV